VMDTTINLNWWLVVLVPESRLPIVTEHRRCRTRPIGRALTASRF
jgi:hypothetical protein